MVYESDFYTTRRPYRTTPSYSTYTTSDLNAPPESGFVDAFKVAQRIDRVLDEPGLLVGKLLSEKLRHESPRHYVVRDSPDHSRRAAEEAYSYSYNSTTESSNRYGDPYSRPSTRSYTSSESVNRSSTAGPGGYSSSTERSSRSSGDGPGGYHSSYSSTTSGRLPGGTNYRHFSYRV